MAVILTFAASLGLYGLLAGQVSGTEIAAGVPTAALVAAFAGFQHGGQTRPLRLRAPWRRVVLLSLAALVKDTVRVGGVLLRAIASPGGAVTGTTDRQPFHPGRAQPADAGRRALVTLASSFAPNGFVLDVPPSVVPGDAGALLVHHLAPSPAKPDPEWPL